MSAFHSFCYYDTVLTNASLTDSCVENETKYRLIDVDGKEITPSELAEKYFGSPDDCFIKADEMLREEERASITCDIYGIFQLSVIIFLYKSTYVGFYGSRGLSPSGTHPTHSRRRRVVRILFGFTSNLDRYVLFYIWCWL